MSDASSPMMSDSEASPKAAETPPKLTKTFTKSKSTSCVRTNYPRREEGFAPGVLSGKVSRETQTDMYGTDLEELENDNEEYETEKEEYEKEKEEYEKEKEELKERIAQLEEEKESNKLHKDASSAFLVLWEKLEKIPALKLPPKDPKNTFPPEPYIQMVDTLWEAVRLMSERAEQPKIDKKVKK